MADPTNAAEKSTMTKADIVEQVYQKIGFSKKEASELVELVFNELKNQLVTGDKVKISGFGNFTVKEKKERIGRNPLLVILIQNHCKHHPILQMVC